MADASTQSPAKPGTACLGCRQRKLKCSREHEGCSNCLKSDLPCIYPAPETGVKRKRGPYKKEKPLRERHLDDLVKYLEPTASQDQIHSDVGALEATPDSLRHVRFLDSNSSGRGPVARVDRKPSNSEDLVKDALIALTTTNVIDRDAIKETGSADTVVPVNDLSGLGIHPPVRQIFEYWHLFVSRVDPMTTIIHCPTFTKTLFSAIDNLQDVDKATETLMFSVYYAAVSSCTAREVRKKFGESRDTLLQRYGRNIEAAMSDNHGVPSIELLQALVLYIIAIRREDSVSNVRALFSLAVRMSQLIALQEDPGGKFSPFETEMRRRLWWQICGLESRGAEEGAARTTSIMEDHNVQHPANLFDSDLEPTAEERPQARTGVTDMTFVLVRTETLHMVHKLWLIRKRRRAKAQDGESVELKAELKASLTESKLRLETNFLKHLHQSRPYDWLVVKFIQSVLIKARLIIEHPFGQLPSKEMSHRERHDLLLASVEIIKLTHSISTHKAVEDWLWYFRGWTQWHSLAIVIAELGSSKNIEFANSAWAVLEPVLAGWDKLYRTKREEPAWDHVHRLIERAREVRQQSLLEHQRASDGPPQHVTQPARGEPAYKTQPSDQLASSMSTGYHDINHVVPAAQPFQPHNWNFQQQQPPPKAFEDPPYLTGCAPSMPGFDGDFGSFEGLDNVDWSAFGAVFGEWDWTFHSSPGSSDWSAMDNVNYHPI